MISLEDTYTAIDSNNTIDSEVKENIKEQTDTYLTYKVYVFKDGDVLENILENA